MNIWLNGLKIILFGWFLIKAMQKTQLSFSVILILLVLLVSGFYRSLYRYTRAKVNMFTLILDLIMTCVFSLITKNADIDKILMIYLIEGTATLPKIFSIVYAVLITLVNVGSFALLNLRETGHMKLLGIAEIMLYGLVFVLVLSERRQREQRMAYEKLSKELECVNLQLNESMELSERLASEAERQRIAGEIHDSLGHNLTGLILTLEAGKRVMNHDVEASRAYLDKAILLSRKAIQSVRELVTQEKESYFKFELIPHLNDMVSEVQSITGLRIELDIKKENLGLVSKEEYCLYRIFQEAITNTLRHSKADYAKISITGSEEVISFFYLDNGKGTDKIEFGNGLMGMKDRITKLGGFVDFYSEIDKGFKINGYIDRRRIKYNED